MITLKTHIWAEPNTGIFILAIDIKRVLPSNPSEYIKTSVNVLSSKRQTLLELVFILETLVELANGVVNTIPPNNNEETNGRKVLL